MNKHTRVAVRLGAAIIAIGVPSMFTAPAGAAGAVTGLGFSSGQIIASAGAIPANSALSFSLRVSSGGTLDPGGAAYVS